MTGGAQVAKSRSEDEEIWLLVREAMRLHSNKERKTAALEKLRDLDDTQALIAIDLVPPYEKQTWRYFAIYIAFAIGIFGTTFIRTLSTDERNVLRLLSNFTPLGIAILNSTVSRPTGCQARTAYARLSRRSTLEKALSFIYDQKLGYTDPVRDEQWASVRKVIEEMNAAGEPISPKAQNEIALRLKAYWPSLWMAKEARLAAQAMLDPAMADRLDKDSLSPLFGLMLEIPYDEAQRLLQQSIRAAFPKPS